MSSFDDSLRLEDTTSASELQAVFDEAHRFFNGGMIASDLNARTWVDTEHIFRPEFYGSPSPRVEMVSSDVHYRQRPHDTTERSIHHEASGAGSLGVNLSNNNPDSYQFIEGLGSTMRCHKAAVVDIMTTLYIYEDNGEGSKIDMDTACAQVCLFVNNVSRRNTVRNIFPRGKGGGPGLGASDLSGTTSAEKFQGTRMREFNRRQISFIHQESFVAGTHNLSVRLKYKTRADYGNNTTNVKADATSGGKGDEWKHVFVEGRNFIVDVHYL